MNIFRWVKNNCWHSRLLVVFMLLQLMFSSVAYAVPSWPGWQSVGQAQLRWGFWVIYDSELRTPDGSYRGIQPELALLIRYRIDIDKEDLLDATDEQWQHLNVDRPNRQLWLRQLAQIWPDVKKGDRLIFELNETGGAFFLDQRLLGYVQNREMAEAFISIWLAPETAYPKLRKGLISFQ